MRAGDVSEQDSTVTSGQLSGFCCSSCSVLEGSVLLQAGEGVDVYGLDLTGPTCKLEEN
jgi:hypothetical protein